MAAGGGKRGPSRRNGGADGHRRRDSEVLDAAATVFYQRGYSASTVQDVANELGILKGSLYYYIQTKEDLLFRLIDGVHDEVDGQMDAIAAREDLDPLGKLEAYVRAQVAYNLDNLVRITIYYHDLDRLGPERLAQVLERRKRHTRFVTDQIHEAQSDGAVDSDLSPSLLANCVFGMVGWSYTWYRRSGRVSKSTVIDHCTSYAMHGLTGA